MTENQTIERAADREAIAPLIELVKAGHLFEVQAWIAAGKPVNPPLPPKGTRPKSPLEWAIERGFHSMVQVLLEGGALQESVGAHGTPMWQALSARRFDLVQLLVEHGYDAAGIDMYQVFETWDPQIMEFFISRGADIHSGDPFCSAFCERIRTALSVYKRLRPDNPDLQVQADTALRFHCREGNMKWVSLMLWAGADPFSPGLSDPGEARYDDEEPLTALGWAALYNHYDVFFLKPIRTQLPGPHASEILRYLTSGKGLDVLKQFLEKGIDPNDQDGGGCSAIPSCVEAMTWGGGLDVYQGWNYGARRGEIDTSASRDRMKAIHLFARHGGKWMPADKRKVGDVRRSLLKMTPDYTVEFVWIMQKYASCKREPVVELLRTPSIRTHVASHWERLRQLIDAWNEDPEPEH